MADDQNRGWFWRLKALGDRVKANNEALSQQLHTSNVNILPKVEEKEDIQYRLDATTPYSNELLPTLLGRMQLPEGIDPDQAMKALRRFQGGKLVWNPELRKYLKAYEGKDEEYLHQYDYGQGMTWKDAYDIEQGVYDDTSGYGTSGAVNLSEEDEEAIKEGEKNLSLMQIAAPHIGSFAQGLKDFYAEGGHEPYMFDYFGGRGRDEE